MPEYNRYEAFLDIHSNDPSGDVVTFKVWDATTGETCAVPAIEIIGWTTLSGGRGSHTKDDEEHWHYRLGRCGQSPGPWISQVRLRYTDRFAQHRSADKVQVGDFAQTASFGQIIVLATRGEAAKNALELCGENNLAGKVIIDATNPIADAPPENGVLKFFSTLDRSLMEDLQEDFPAARLVKCFSCVGHAHMVDPDFDTRPSMFICGNDQEAKADVRRILDTFGWDIEDMGGVEAARAIEPLCILWCIPLFQGKGPDHALKMLHK
jgi:predicted dinucleotide-binding enzyme